MTPAIPERRRRTIPRPVRHLSAMIFGALLITAGLAILLRLVPEGVPSAEPFRDKVAAGLIAAGTPFLVFGNGAVALGWIRSFIPVLNRRQPPTPTGGDDGRG